MSSAGKWMELENTMLSQTQRLACFLSYVEFRLKKKREGGLVAWLKW
jgi:hypothetical protein